MAQKQLEIHDKAEEIKTEMGLLEKQKKLSRKPPLVRHDFLSDTGSHFDIKEVDRQNQDSARDLQTAKSTKQLQLRFKNMRQQESVERDTDDEGVMRRDKQQKI